MNRDDTLSAEDRFAGFLVACDRALAAAEPPPAVESATELPPDLKPRLERDLACVQVLRRVLPRYRPLADPPTPGSDGEANLGRFRLRRKLGQGAYGVVWLAYDPRLGREVALKVPRGEVLEDSAARERFLREGRAAAVLDHPNVVPVYEAGEVGPVCYLASAYCPGPTLAAWLKGRSELVSGPTAAALTALLADAVQHAHDHRVIHRDLKPSNVLLNPRPEEAVAADGEPALDFVPRLTDFGLAKLLDQEDAGRTRSGAIVGTPQYMAPEQAWGKAANVGPRSDVYALGAILYEVLTGRPPFQGESVLDLLEQVRTREPVPPRRLRPLLPRDLETICLKCLEKDPKNRYASAAALAEDLRRFLDGKSVRARPLSGVERLGKWVRRRPATASVYALLLFAFVLGGGGGAAAWLWQRAEGARDQLASEKGQTEAALGREADLRKQLARLSYARNVALAYEEWKNNRLERADEALQACPAELRDWEWHHVYHLCHPELLTLRGHDDLVRGVCFSPDGKRIASAGRDKAVKVWDARTGELLLNLTGHDQGVHGVAFSPDGKLLASAAGGPSPPDKAVTQPLPGEGKLWDAETGRQLRSLDGRGRWFWGVQFNPDGTRLAGSCLQMIGRDAGSVCTVWDLSSGEELPTLAAFGAAPEIGSIAWSPDWKQFARKLSHNFVQYCDTQTGRSFAFGPDANGRPGIFGNLTFSPEGNRLMSAVQGDVRVWELTSGQQTVTLPGAGGAAFSPDGKRLATAGGGITVRDATTGQSLFTIRGHSAGVEALAFSPDGTRLVSAGRDGVLKVWAVADPRGPSWPGRTWDLALSPEGKRLAACREGRVRTLDATTLREIQTLGEGDQGLAFSPDGRRLASGFLTHDASWDITACGVKVWALDSGREIQWIASATGQVRKAAFSPDGQLLVTASTRTVRGNRVFPGELRGWEWRTGRELFCSTTNAEGGNQVAFSRDGQWVASAAAGGVLTLWEARTGREVRVLGGREADVTCVAFSWDGTRLASAGADFRVRMWDVPGGEERLAFPTSGRCSALTFNPAGTRLIGGVSGLEGTGLGVWDATSGQEILTLPEGADGLLFSPGASALATITTHCQVNVRATATPPRQSRGRAARAGPRRSEWGAAAAQRPRGRGHLRGLFAGRPPGAVRRLRRDGSAVGPRHRPGGAALHGAHEAGVGCGLLRGRPPGPFGE